jgi:acetylornithine/succinyldiaminopimelate/putrescine aminotransferase
MDAIELETRYSAHNYARLPVVLTRGQGAHLWDKPLSVLDGFLRFSDAIARLAEGMWGGLRQPAPVRAIKRIVTAKPCCWIPGGIATSG